MTSGLITHFAKLVIASSTSDFVPLDADYLFNRILHLVGSDTALSGTPDLTTSCNQLVDLAIHNQKIADLQSARDNLGAELMNFLNPLPSEVNHEFQRRYAISPEQATDYFYALSQETDYIKTRAIAKNIVFNTPTTFGDLEITINLSKPEKDPKQIAAARLAKPTTNQYPLCQLCKENEGYYGRTDYPARANLRMIHHDIDGAGWEFQYSPYAYFSEHAIFLADEHRPMKINRLTFVNLLNIITWLPHYFVGSNADLPIVGGSILTHEHYQGGRHTFPMEVAPIVANFKLTNFPAVSAGIVHWPMSVIRLTSDNQKQLSDAAEQIRIKWDTYSDATVDVQAFTGTTPHHTITPIARRTQDGAYQIDIVLRDNQTSAQYPDGIFHPHPDVQHIKQENIGLIEVMGRAILPPRLKPELAEVRKFLLGQPNDMKAMHRPWAEQLQTAHPDINANNVTTILQQAIGTVFARVLSDAGVFKQDQQGQEAFMRFVATLND
ncbi:galactose-1-phosphate uridylyltransferase [Lactobacillus selangorensis]|uniref:Galactose-1-phosphate uridylyltransferase n=1 Tax=Lactobacillus selangorensis TaxID=81857 RepID=A0A0R2G2N1_9LACO|nr:UDP-glucose--hexose-1-phosphate uridylyltransferase [Lactobacillus selangorensis]KRN29284.1 galactose-1-phosphate uridylyltransferase [Lactobacillus selangorensis]KRN34187.1 galactose-1-phosphate uridylyltransferase [Lactobacillus selangorensis]